jgi:hypothetical protein
VRPFTVRTCRKSTKKTARKATGREWQNVTHIDVMRCGVRPSMFGSSDSALRPRVSVYGLLLWLQSSRIRRPGRLRTYIGLGDCVALRRGPLGYSRAGSESL